MRPIGPKEEGRTGVNKIKHYKYSPVTKPRDFEESENLIFLDSRHVKLVKLSSLRTSRLYLQEILLVFNSVGV
jgi:hypothetical protein